MSSRADFALASEAPQHFGLEAALTYIWDVPTLAWVKSTGGGGGGGGAVTIADGADVAQGTTTDAAWVAGAGTVISLLKKIASAGGGAVSIADGSDVAEGATADAAVTSDAAGTVSGKLRGLVKWAYERMPAALAAGGGLKVEGVAGGVAQPVSGTFFQATQPISAAALPLPAGAATSALQTQPGVDIGDVTINNAAGASAVNVQDGGNSLTVDAPVGTPVFARLSDGAAALIGQKVMVSSLPVVLASDQSGVAVTNAGLTNLDVALSTRLKPADTLTAVTTVTAVTAITNALPIGANIIGSVNGDVDHDAANTLKQIQVGGNASPVDVPPAVVSANGDRVRGWFTRSGARVVRHQKLRESYTAVFRLAEAAARLDPTFTFTANTNKQLATLHHTAGSTKEAQLMKCQIGVILLGTAAGQTIFEIREINTAPATGNPAITPKPHRFGGTASEAVALTLPTTAGTEVAVNSPLGSAQIDYGIMAAGGSTLNPMAYGSGQLLTLYDASQEDDEQLTPTLPVATLSGWSITGRSTAAVVLRFYAIMRFSEEIP